MCECVLWGWGGVGGCLGAGNEALFHGGQLCVPLSPLQPPGEAAESFAQSYDVVMVN